MPYRSRPGLSKNSEKSLFLLVLHDIGTRGSSPERLRARAAAAAAAACADITWTRGPAYKCASGSGGDHVDDDDGQTNKSQWMDKYKETAIAETFIRERGNEEMCARREKSFGGPVCIKFGRKSVWWSGCSIGEACWRVLSGAWCCLVRLKY